ncbi:MAG: ceramidase domain-containing protein [Pirellulales bacterium]|nr:ceramidase domain-containing protein [Pirellulales bacterium]
MRTRIALLLAVAFAASVGMFLHAPILQLPDYHSFADQETILGVPNFWNVVSNAPFLLVGGWGLFVLTRKHTPGLLPPLRGAYFCLFVGTLLVGLGSSYYHLDPNDSTLVWDRLPMTIAFMAVLAIAVGEYIDVRWGARLLVPLLVCGVLSIVYWHRTGDLRPYFLVQFLTLLLIFLILLLFRPGLRPASYFWLALGSYGLAKILELLDLPIYNTLHGTSGHTLKHLAAAVAIALLVLAVKRRRPEPEKGNRRAFPVSRIE